jgi:hypothetical protein
VTAGRNSFGHPAPDVLARWEAAGATLFQVAADDGTPVDGDVTVTAASDGTFTVTGQTGQTYTAEAGDPTGSSTTVAQPITPACVDAPVGRFADVSGTHQAGIDCIGWWGVTQGTGDGTYNPAGTVRRDQMASFVARTLTLTGGTLPGSPPDVFADDDGNTHEANINRVAAAGLTGGTADGGYDPSGEVSRAQMGTFLARLLAKLVADGHIDYPPTDPVALPDPDPEPDPTPDPGPAPGCVDLNSASFDDLQQIVHIGPDRAQAIIDARPWTSVQQLDQLDGIGPSRLQDILDQNLACVS